MATCGICKQSRSNDHIRWHYKQRYTSSAAPTPSRGQAQGVHNRPERVAQAQLAKRPAVPHVPDGYYATRDPAGTVHFWRVTHSNGYLRLQIQASDLLHRVDSYARRVGVAKAIAADIPGARKLYATELGRCYVCGRTLTDEESRANGIGPVCAARSAA